jgi:hypothetical protein
MNMMLVGPREYLDGLVKNKFSCLAGNPNPGYQISIPDPNYSTK